MDDDFRVGDWLVRPQLNRIAAPGGEHHVEPKVMEVLVRLARRPGAVVSRDDLLSEVWPDTVVVETAVFRAISELRRIFDDDPKQPRVIETVRKRGYRLIARVEPAGEEPAPTTPPRSLAAPPRSRTTTPSRGRAASLRAAVLGAVAVALAATVAISFRATHVTVDARLPSWPAPPLVVASSTDLELAPALSPDGRGLAYVRRHLRADGSRLWKIYVKLPGDGAPRLLNPGTVDEGPPTWSPDGDSIAFWRHADQASELAVVRVLGGPARVLIRARVRASASLSWAGDGSWLAAAWRTFRDSPLTVYRVGLDGEATPLTRPPEGWYGDGDPRISPDGKAVAFVRSSVPGHEQDLYLVSADGGEPRRLTYDRKPIRGLTWRDDERLIFSSKRSNEFALWQVAVGSGTLEWTGVTEALSPSYSRAANALAYEHVEREINVWQAESTGGTTRLEPLIRSTQVDRTPHVRPDGKAIAFSSDRTGHFEIWTSDRDGNNPRQVTDLRQFATRPRWSHDGRRLAFSADGDGNHDLYVIDAEGFPPRRLTHHPASDQAPSWSPDGRWIYFASVRGGIWQVWKVATGGGEPVLLTPEGGFTAHASHDGRWIYFSRPTAKGLWRLPAEGGAAERVLEEYVSPTLNDWDVVGERIVITLPQGERLQVFAHHPDQRSTTALTELPLAAGFDLAVPNDLRSVLYTQLDRRASDIHQVRLSP